MSDADRVADAATMRSTFDELLRGADQPIVIVTARDSDGRIGGCLVGFASQCSITPARFAVWLSIRNHTYSVARNARQLAVHVLTAHDRPLAELFGSATGHERDKFAECEWERGPSGVPIISVSGGWFTGPAEHHPMSGDHALFVVTPDAASGRIDGKPLSFQDVKDIQAGNPA